MLEKDSNLPCEGGDLPHTHISDAIIKAVSQTLTGLK